MQPASAMAVEESQLDLKRDEPDMIQPPTAVGSFLVDQSVAACEQETVLIASLGGKVGADQYTMTSISHSRDRSCARSELR